MTNIPTHTVVVGGRYVVGENPTYRASFGAFPLQGVAGRTITVTDGPDVNGDFEMEHDEWIDPRHLTPAPQPVSDGFRQTDTAPAAAPAVDDELLRDIHRAAGVGSAWSTKPEEWAARLLASEPMQRLRAAWTEEAERERDEWQTEAEGAAADGVRLRQQIAQLINERDEECATKDLHKGRQQELETALNTAVRERDEARAELAESRSRFTAKAAEVTALGAERDRVIDERNNAEDRRDALAVELATVERLRAAQQQLPDVGPVTRLMSGVLSVGDDYRWHDLSLDQHEESALRELAAIRAARAFLDAEADNTSSDDEVRTLAVDLYDVGLHTVGPDDLDNRQLAERLLKLGWHRARGGQEAGQ